MAERVNPTPDKTPKADPLQRARDQFERAASPDSYDATAILKSLDRVRTIGTRLGKSPGELYAELANMSARAADIAGTTGNEEEKRVFTQQHQEFQQTSDNLTPGGIALPSSQSRPGRTTGRASG